MAATGTPTPNIGLRIPLGTDPASVDDINYNSNLIDTKLGAVGNDSVQDQLDDLNSKIGKYIQRGISNYSVTQGGWAGRNTITVNLGYEMPTANYYANAHVTDAYSDFPQITFYCFNKTKTTFDVLVIDSATGSTVQNGNFEWIAIHTF